MNAVGLSSPPDAVRSARAASDNQLKKRHRLMVEYMVYGLSQPTLLARLPERLVPAGRDKNGAPLTKLGRPELHEPLSLEDAAAACNIRLRAARYLSRQRAFQHLLAAEIGTFREGARARATRRMVALIDEPGQGKAADRKVQLSAAQAVLGEGDAASHGPTINVFNGGQQLVAGIVIRLPDSAKSAPLEQPHTIEHEEEALAGHPPGRSP